MKINRNQILTGALIIFVLIFIVYFVSSNKQKRYNWYESYKKNDKQPYGGYVIYQLLKSYFNKYDLHEINDNLSASNVLKNKENENQNYFFLGAKLFLKPEDLNALKQFIYKGNTAFIAAHSIPRALISTRDSSNFVNNTISFPIKKDTLAIMNFTHPSLKKDSGFKYRYKFKHKFIAHSWRYFDINNDSLNKDILKLGYFDKNKTNFFKIEHGKGRFIIHTNPLVFTNYHLNKKSTLGYVENVLSHINKGEIYWDTFSKISHISTNHKISESPFSFILSQPSLKWAWYLGILLILIYLFFRSKRKQKIIPVAPTLKNSSLEFVKTVGRLYYQQKDHKKLANQKFRLFINDLRKKYHIQINKKDDDFYNLVAIKSGVNKQLIQKIFQRYENIKQENNILKSELMEFHDLLEEYYRKRK